MTRAWRAVCLLLVLIGGCSFVRSHQVRAAALALPRLPLATFAREGAGDQRFVVLTDLRVDYEGAVFHRDMDAAIAMYARVYAALRTDGTIPPVVLEILDDRDRERLRDDPEPEGLACQVDRAIDRVDPAFLAALEKKHPGTSFAAARLATVGLHEPTERKADELWWYGVGALVFAAGIPIVSAGIRRSAPRA
jgi:hypothetical protein